jgi:uncharacterized protein
MPNQVLRHRPQAPLPYPWDLRGLLQGRPSVGLLMDLCEENYRRLRRLAPELERLRGGQRCPLDGRPAGGMDLHLEVLEQTPYTTLFRLTYFFGPEGERLPDPDAVIRAFHDARQAEILELQQSALPLDKAFHHPALEQKWRANQFLSKWLSYCVAQGYRFPAPDR